MNTEPDKKPEDEIIPANAQETPLQEDATPMEQSAQATSPDTEFFTARIKALEDEVAMTKDRMMRVAAEAENTRRRAMKDREDASKYAVSNFARDLLDFSDNFRRALAAIPEELRSDEKVTSVIVGLEAMDAQLLNTFEKNGIKKIEPLDEPFNPNFHEVMFEAPIPGKPGGMIIQVVEAGYMINDRLLRAAKVGISKGDSVNHQVDQSA